MFLLLKILPNTKPSSIQKDLRQNKFYNLREYIFFNIFFFINLLIYQLFQNTFYIFLFKRPFSYASFDRNLQILPQQLFKQCIIQEMNLKRKLPKNQQSTEQTDLFFDQQEQKQSNSKPKKQEPSVKTQQIKKGSKKGSKKPQKQKITQNTVIKLQPKDLRFYEQVLQEKHGKFITLQQMLEYKKKMSRDTYNESNPYRHLNYNTGQENEYRDNMKKALTPSDLKKYKQQFLNIMKMVDRGEHAKYTLRDLAQQFNLDQSAVLQLRRQFSIDPDVSIYLNKKPSSLSNPKQSTQIANRQKKIAMLNTIIQRNPLLTKVQLSDKITRYIKNKDFFPQSQIQRLLQLQGFGWRKIVKYPQSRNFKQNLQRRKVFCQKINFILTQTKYKVYFLGLMNFNTFMFRQQGWSKDQYLLQPVLQESFTLVSLAERVGEGTWKFQKQVYKEQRFLQTIKTLFDILLPQRFQPKYVVVDFSLFRYQEALKKSRKKYDVQIIWIPPFSYKLNPLQFWFQEIKTLLSKSKRMLELSQQCNMITKKNQVLIKDIYADLCQIFKSQYDKDFQFTKYFAQAAKYHEKALKLQKF